MAQAGVIYTVTDHIIASDPSQLGRLSRNGIPQDWSGSEAFPGIINAAVTYHSRAFSINVGVGNFIQIDVDSTSASTFASVYQTSFDPTNLTMNWLGDAGASGNPLPGDPLFFQVVAALNSNIIVVMNNTGASNVGVGDAYTITVESYVDSEFTDPPAVTGTPEPTSLALGGLGLAAIGLLSRRRAARG
jgi:MYXO-CTERM domain-containing protein